MRGKVITRLRILVLCFALVGLVACPIPVPVKMPSGVPLPRPPSSGSSSDPQVVVQWVVDACLSRPWLDDWKEARGREPRIEVGRVQDLSILGINEERVAQRMDAALMRSHFGTGRAAPGKVLDPDIVLHGVIDQSNTGRNNKNRRTFSFTVELVDLATAERLCSNQGTVAWRE